MVEARAYGALTLVDDVSAADWIVANVRNFQHDVGSLLPVTFDAYARVLHPALRDCPAGEDIDDVTWADVAAANGRAAHAAMEWVAITGDWSFVDRRTQPGVWDRAPSTGRLPQRQAAALADVLARFTTTPAECWFAVWDGYGNAPYQRGALQLIRMPQRPMVLLSGPLRAAGAAFSGGAWPESASLWWPADRTWCVATDIDLMSTYLGGTVECIAAMLADQRLEAYPVSVDQTVHWKSDTVNPTPDPPPPPPPVSAAMRRRVLDSLRAGLPSSSTVTSRGPQPTPPGDIPGQ